jgi:4-amino-4-deoxy-L-arabinose transferase-like glycosyltransferase
MSVVPTQLHMSQHALVDGFFTFWALLCLWLFWENLRAPHNWRWVIALAIGLALLVLTKENSFFVWIALIVLLVVNRWLQFGTVTRELIVAMIVGPLLGVVVLVFLAGGIDMLWQTYQLSVGKNFELRYAILTGDGPWYRYIVDLILVSPVVVILALGSIFRLDRTKKPELFMSIFIAASYLVMCNVKYGMNLRYANIWDMPLRFLAFGSLVGIVAPIRRYRNIMLGIAVALICAIELRQYIILFCELSALRIGERRVAARAPHFEVALSCRDYAAWVSTSAFNAELPEIVSRSKLFTVGFASARMKIW